MDMKGTSSLVTPGSNAVLLEIVRNICDLSVTSGGCCPVVLPACLVARRKKGNIYCPGFLVETCESARSSHEREVLDKSFD